MSRPIIFLRAIVLLTALTSASVAADPNAKCQKRDTSTKFDTPVGPMTDEEIGARQKLSDLEFALRNPSFAMYEAGSGEIKQFSESFAREYGKTPGERNALQHAIWQALLTYEYGDDVAKTIGDQHEKWQEFGNEDRKRDCRADKHNNEVGREIGNKIRNQFRKTLKGPSPRDLIQAAIIEAFRAGRFDLSGGVGGQGVGLCAGKGKIHTLNPMPGDESPLPDDPGNPPSPPTSGSPQPTTASGSSQVSGNPPLPPLPELSATPWYGKRQQ
jgi:hypothetical protein